MSPESVNFLDTAARQLEDAEAALASGLHRLAARVAYDVALSSARAIIFEKTREAPKTHSGARNQLSKLVQEGMPLDRSLLKFLADGYEIKADFDYGPVSPISEIEAIEAVTRARAFFAAARKACE